MLCDVCHTREAKVHLTLLEADERRTKLDVCTVCLPPTLSEEERNERMQRLLAEKRNQPPGTRQSDGAA
jgi:protein-arginine kinase activator protein McsA